MGESLWIIYAGILTAFGTTILAGLIYYTRRIWRRCIERVSKVRALIERAHSLRAFLNEPDAGLVNALCNIEANIEKLEKQVRELGNRLQRLEVITQPHVPGMLRAGKIEK